MKYSKYIFIGLILLIIPGCTTKEWQESSYLKGLGLKGKIIAKSNDIYIIDLNTKQRIPINIINTEKIGLYVTGIPIWGKDENIILPTKNGIVELNGEKQIVLKNESMIMSVLFDKENNQIFYVNGHLEIKRVSLTYKTEKLIRGKEVIGSWISYFNNKIAFQSRNGTKVLDIKNNSIIEEYRNYNFYTFSPDGKVAYIKENDSKEGSKDQLIIENKYNECRKKISVPWGNDLTWSPDGNYLFFTSLEWGFPYQTARINLYDFKKNKVYVLWRGITKESIRARSWKY